MRNPLSFPITLFLILALLRSAPAECSPIAPETGQFVDRSCHTFRMVLDEEGYQFIVKEKDGRVLARESVDCSKATYESDGTFEFWSHLAKASVWCPAYSNTDIEQKLKEIHEENLLHRRR